MDDEDFFSNLDIFMPEKLNWYERSFEKRKVAKSRLASGTILI